MEDAFAKACLNLGSLGHKHSESEQYLLSLRSSPIGIDLSLQILFKTSQENPAITYHAAMLLRDASIRQFSLEQSNRLVPELIKLALSKPSTKLADALLQAAAAIYKRAFSSNSHSFNSSILETCVFLLFSKKKQEEWCASRLLTHVIWEFSLSAGRSTSLGQTMDFHIQSGKKFTVSFLQPLFVKVAEKLIGSRQEEEGEDESVLTNLLLFLDVSLNWPFELYSSESVGVATESSVANSKRVFLGKEWAFLCHPNFVSGLLGILHMSKSLQVMQAVKQILITLCGLGGGVIQDDNAQIAFSLQLCQVGYQLCLSENESLHLLDGCEVVSKALTMPKLDLLTTLVEKSHFENLLGLTLKVSNSAQSCAAAKQVSYRTTFLQDALAMLVNAWVLLCGKMPVNDQRFKSSVFQVFSSLLMARVSSCPFEDDDDNGDDEADEFVRDVSCLARISFETSIRFVRSLLQQQQIQPPSSNRCEVICFLSDLVASILADPDEGEIPSLPECVVKCNDDSVVLASLDLLNLFESETLGIHQGSPLLSETLIKSIRIWSASYLYTRFDYFGHASPVRAAQTLERIVKLSCIHLQHFGSEEIVCNAVFLLLQSLIEKRGVNNVWVIKTCSAWQALFKAHLDSLSGSNWAPLDSLGAVSHGQLIQVLASSCSDVAEFDQKVFYPVKQRVSRLVASSANFESIAIRVTELFHGIAKTRTNNLEIAYRVRECVVFSLNDLLNLSQSSSSSNIYNEGLMLSILSVFTDFCDAQLCLTESNLIPPLYDVCGKLVVIFVRIQVDSREKYVLTKPDQAELEFRADSLTLVLKLLNSLSDRNTLDFSESFGQSASEDDPSSVILVGIASVLQLVDLDILHFSKVAESFFDLVSGMCRMRAEYVSRLPQAIFQTILNALTFGCQHHESRIQRESFESISALCEAHLKNQCLNRQLEYVSNLFDLWLSKMLEQIMNCHEIMGSSLECAAFAILHCALCQPQTVNASVERAKSVLLCFKREDMLIDPSSESLRIQSLQNVLETEFSTLLSSLLPLNFPVDRVQRKNFCKSVQHFVSVVRAFVLIQ